MQAFSVGQLQDIFYLRIDPGDLLLESLQQFLENKKIRDAIILSGLGSLSICNIHTVEGHGNHPSENRFIHIEGAIEILSLTGLIINYEPHLHISLFHNNITIGGHVEKECQIFTMAEISLGIISPTNLTRIRTPEITGYHYKNIREIHNDRN